MSSKLSEADSLSIRAKLAVAIATAPKRGTMVAPEPPVLSQHETHPVNTLQISETDLAWCVQRAVLEAEALDQRTQRPLVSDARFEAMYRDYQRRSDRYSCFVACLAGALNGYAPEAAALISAFLERGYARTSEAPDGQ